MTQSVQSLSTTLRTEMVLQKSEELNSMNVAESLVVFLSLDSVSDEKKMPGKDIHVVRVGYHFRKTRDEKMIDTQCAKRNNEFFFC